MGYVLVMITGVYPEKNREVLSPYGRFEHFEMGHFK
jgi:hypothetical protein